MSIVGKTLRRTIAGPLELTSRQARQAIGASLQFFSTQAAEPDRSAAYSPTEVFTDELGQTHVRLERTQGGLRVLGGEVIAHLDPSGAVVGSTGGPPLGTLGDARRAPAVSQARALAAATDAFAKASGGMAPGKPPTSELVFAAGDDGRYRQAYSISLESLKVPSGPLQMRYLIDANSGETLAAYNELDGYFSGPQGEKLRTALASKAADPFVGATNALSADTGQSLYSGVVPLSTHRNEDGTFSLKDDARGGGETKDNLERWMVNEAVAFKDDNNVWGEATDSPRQRAGIDAHYAMAMTWDFLKNVLGRESIDGRGLPLNSFVHFAQSVRETDDPNDSEPINNAYWNGSEMIYGDGDGIMYSPLVCLDVAGHEIAHGLTHATAGLEPFRESGGLGEAISDIFGIGVRWYASLQNPSVKFSWRHGEQVFTPNIPDDARRYMDDPTRDGYSIDHYSKAGPLTRNPRDNGGTHATSGIANNAFYLMVEGGTNRTSGLGVDRGIGMAKALKIVYRALTTYFSSRTGFQAAAEGMVRAAVDLHGEGSPEVAAVRQAWTAVGALQAST